MIKCPNCGSTAQMKEQYIPHQNNTAITRVLTCGCGCETTTYYTLVREITRTKNGTQIGHRKGERK
jgi:C4-type Zn-finger protein